MADLEIRNLHVSAEDKEILKGVDLDVSKGEIHALMGPNGSGKSTLANAVMGHPGARGHRGHDPLQGRGHHRGRSRGPLADGPLHGLPVPGGDPRRDRRQVPAHGGQRPPRRPRRARDQAEGLPQDDRGGDGAGQHPARLLEPLPERRLLRRREEADGDPPARDAQARDGGPRRDRLGPRHRRAARRRRGREHVRRPRDGHADHHPLPAHPAPDRARPRPRHVPGPDRQGGRPRAGRRARGQGLRPIIAEVEGAARRPDAAGRHSMATPASTIRSQASARPSRRSRARSTASRSRTSTRAPPRSASSPRSRPWTATSAATTRTSTAARTRSRPRRPPPTRAPARRSPTTSAPPTGARSSSSATRPRRSTSSPAPGATRTSAPATGSCSPRWSTTRTSSPGSSSPSAPAPRSTGSASPTTARSTWTRFAAALERGPKVVAVTHVSNVLGTLNPLAEISRLAHDAGAIVVADGAQAAPKLAVDVAELGVDFYALTGHKAYAPTGIGALWGRLDLLREMQPFLGGGSMIRKVTTEGTTWADVPARFEAGTPGDHAGDRLRRGAALARRHRHGARDRARARDHRLRDGAPRRGAGPDDLRPAARAPSASARSRSSSRASTPTTSRRSSTATASPSAPATTAPSR